MGQQALGSNLLGRKQWVNLPSGDGSPEGPSFMGYATDQRGVPYGRGGSPYDQGGTGISEEPGILPGNGGQLPGQYQDFGGSGNQLSGRPSYLPPGSSTTDKIMGVVGKLGPYGMAAGLGYKIYRAIMRARANSAARGGDNSTPPADNPDQVGGGGGGGFNFRAGHDPRATGQINVSSAPGGGSLYSGRAPYVDPAGVTHMQSLAGTQSYGGRQGQANMGGLMNFGDIPGGGLNSVGQIGSGESGGVGKGPSRSPQVQRMMSGGYQTGDSGAYLADHPEVRGFINSIAPQEQRINANTSLGSWNVNGGGNQQFNSAVNQALISRNLRGIPMQSNAAPIVTHAARTQGK
jgi:hypothetical protein